MKYRKEELQLSILVIKSIFNKLKNALTNQHKPPMMFVFIYREMVLYLDHGIKKMYEYIVGDEHIYINIYISIYISFTYILYILIYINI